MTMKDFSKKMKLIYLPYLGGLIITILICVAIRWVFYDWLGILTDRNSKFGMLIIMFFGFLGSLFSIHKGLKLLKFKTGFVQWEQVFMLIAMLPFMMPTIAFHDYLSIAMKDLVALENIENITDQGPVAYYTIEDFALDSIDIGFHRVIYDNYQMRFYTVWPITKKDTSDGSTNTVAWYGKLYTKNLANRDNAYIPDSLNAAFNRFFYDDVLPNFDTDKLTNFQYLERETDVDHQDFFTKAAQMSTRYNFKDGEAITILRPIQEPYSERNARNLFLGLMSFGIGVFIFLIALLFIPSFKEEETAYINTFS